MSMPEFPKPDVDLTQEQALTMILSSIALEELALSHIINAEGEKLQYILACHNCNSCSNCCNCNSCSINIEDILAVNKSVTSLLEVVLQNQMILKNKMEKVLEYLPVPPKWPCPPKPPIPPCPPEPPMPPCPPNPSTSPCMQCECCSCKDCVCFAVIPKIYCRNEPLQWHRGNEEQGFIIMPQDCSKIQLTSTGSFIVDICLALDCLCHPLSEAKLILFCEEQAPIIKTICPHQCCQQNILYRGTITIAETFCSPCHLSVMICVPDALKVIEGSMTLTRM